MKVKYLLFLPIFFCIVLSCKKDSEKPVIPSEVLYPLNIVSTNVFGDFKANSVSWLADTSSGYVLRISNTANDETPNDSALYVYFNRKPNSSFSSQIVSFPTYNTDYSSGQNLTSLYLYLQGKYYSIDNGGSCKLTVSGTGVEITLKNCETERTPDKKEVLLWGRVAAAKF